MDKRNSQLHPFTKSILMLIFLFSSPMVLANLGGVWSSDCDDSQSAKPPAILLITPLYFKQYHQILVCTKHGCINNRNFAEPTTIYNDDRFSNITTSSFIFKASENNKEVHFNHCDLNGSLAKRTQQFEAWQVTAVRQLQIDQIIDKIDYNDPISVTKVFFESILNEEYDVIPYLVIPKDLIHFSPIALQKLRSGINLSKNQHYTLSFDKRKRALVGVDNTELGIELQRYNDKWLLER
jgi:hypothetical protein